MGPDNGQGSFPDRAFLVSRPARTVFQRTGRRSIQGTWFLLIGCLLILMVMVGTRLKRLPLTASLLYLGAGILLGPHGIGFLDVGILEHPRLWEHLTEVAVIIS